ncbi:MAG: hypothetical protein ACKVU0_05920 [Saprospiraceae bacterium]
MREFIIIYKPKYGKMPMEETYTYDAQMVQFLYRELSAGDAVEMAHLIEDDSEISADFNALLLAKAQLPKVQFNPSPTVLHNILQYSSKTALEAHF